MMETIILASQSPRRRELLHLAEIPFEICVANTDEHFPEGLSFDETVIYIAKNKALKVAETHPGKLLLAADTIVISNNKILGKPANAQEAIDFLSQLSGVTHQVITGVYICKANKELFFADTAQVTFHTITKEQIEYYVHKYQPFDKAGAYAIQEWIGAVAIKRIEGDFYNVMGLPISRVVAALQSFK